MLALPNRQLVLVTKAVALLSPAARDDFLARLARLRRPTDDELASVITTYLESAMSLSEPD
jgi:hypothetical protein